MMAVDVRTSPKFTAGPSIPRFDVSQGGRFLIPAQVNQDVVPIHIVTNWQAGLKK